MTLLSTLLSKEKHDEVSKLFNEIDKNSEFEISIYNTRDKYIMTDKYILITKVLNARSKKLNHEVIHNTFLDINFTTKDTVYRITLNNIQDINQVIEQFHKFQNHVIFRVLAEKANQEKNKLDITLMKKVKNRENFIDLDNIYSRVRLATETEVSKEELKELKNLTYKDIKNIVFRFKQRISFNVDNLYVIDLTMTKTSNNINAINNAIQNYELEIELLDKKNKNALNKILEETEFLIKIIQQSNYVTTKNMSDKVLENYARILDLDVNKIISLEGRNSESLEIYNLVDTLPNRYAVTDKADGDRHFLIIIESQVYVISQNLNVRYTGIELESKEYDDTILDGEYIFISKKNRHLFMTFDCLFYKGEDIRPTTSLFKRLEYADDVVYNCFTDKKHKGYKFGNYDNSKDKEFSLEKISEYYTKEVETFINNLNNDLEIEKKKPLIRRKFFIFITGVKPWEIFKYSSIMWQQFVENDNIKCPYQLDGLIYQPLEQAYVTSNTLYKDFKWKPPTKNSIDFYIKFRKNEQTGEKLIVFDNSMLEDEDGNQNLLNKRYVICDLHVGKRSKYIGDGKSMEEPVLFREKEDGYVCKLLLNGDNIIDIEGNLLIDNTVVEFYYNNDPELPEEFRWVPIRTRHDKTESVMRYKKKYGNYETIAMAVWNTIKVPILMSDIIDLARGNDIKNNKYYYDDKLEEMRRKISAEMIAYVTKEQTYFQAKNKNLAVVLRKFDNWVKSQMIFTICNQIYTDNKRKLNIIDFGFGKGQDLYKYYFANIGSLVALELDREALFSAVDGALSRYNSSKKTKRAVPPMDFIHADVGALLTVDDQTRALGGMNKQNKDLLEKYFKNNKKFDILTANFMIHYLLKNDLVWSNFKENIKNSIDEDGLVLITTTADADRIKELLKDKERYTAYYETEGEKKVLYELVKKYSDSEINKQKIVSTGFGVDINLSWIFGEGVYKTEYLVDKKFLEEELKKDCSLELVETATFDVIYDLHKEFLTEYITYEENEKTKKTLGDITPFYSNKDELNKYYFEIMKLNRYFIFRKVK